MDNHGFCILCFWSQSLLFSSKHLPCILSMRGTALAAENPVGIKMSLPTPVVPSPPPHSRSPGGIEMYSREPDPALLVAFVYPIPQDRGSISADNELGRTQTWLPSDLTLARVIAKVPVLFLFLSSYYCFLSVAPAPPPWTFLLAQLRSTNVLYQLYAGQHAGP